MQSGLQILKSIIPDFLLLFFRPLYHYMLALSAALTYGFPSRKLFVIGVTGTKGKTTVVELLHELFEEAGFKTASVSSLRFKIGSETQRNELKMTMPGRFFVQKFLHEARKADAKYAIIEVTSEGIAQFRHRFISFDMAVMTNVAPEHLESHGGFEPYLRSKLDLFWRMKPDTTAVINRDDREGNRFFAATIAHKVWYGKEGVAVQKKNLSIRNIEIGAEGIRFELDRHEIASPLLGEFNFYNIIAVISVGLSRHISIEKIQRVLGRVSGIPGRMEFVRHSPFAVVVDYAHTPDSLRKVYETIQKFNEFKSLICVLGAAGGGRDTWKRAEFGTIASEFCSRIILTDEDPYDEDPDQILSQIKSGVTSNQLLVTKLIVDRREAIREALQVAGPGDVVVITGKGAELWIMGPNGEKTPWDDRQVVKEELEHLH